VLAVLPRCALCGLCGSIFFWGCGVGFSRVVSSVFYVKKWVSGGKSKIRLDKSDKVRILKYIINNYEGEFSYKMLALLISLSFNFDSIPSPRFAGDSFFVYISASDSSEVSCFLSVIPLDCGLELCVSEDNLISFKEGNWHGWVRIPIAADSIRLCCSYNENGEFSLSNEFSVKDRIGGDKLRQGTISDSIDIYPNPLTPEYDFVNIEYYLSDNARVLVMIFDKFGNPVWNTETDESAGLVRTRWDGTDNGGRRVLSGVYIVCIKATNQARTVARYTGKIAVIR